MKVGDKVKLKSGGQTMVVTRLFTDLPADIGLLPENLLSYKDKAECSWIDNNETPQSQWYPENCLEIVTTSIN